MWKLAFALLPLALLFGCSDKKSGGGSGDDGGGDGSSGDGGGADAASDGLDFDIGGGDTGDDGSPDVPIIVSPKTCTEAATTRSYVGCEFWPTVTSNGVWSIFDFAAVVANAGDTTARIHVTGPGGFVKDAFVDPNRSLKLYLPWVPALKGNDGDNCGATPPPTQSILAAKSAYRLVSDRPVTVYQFNALEYQGKNGKPGKDWTTCPGNSDCVQPDGTIARLGCFSFTNDASLLLPTTAMTRTYRVTSNHGEPGAPAYMVITATQDATTVKVTLSAHGRVLGGKGVTGAYAKGTTTLTMNAGDVAELVGLGTPASDPSGSLVTATAPVQVITGVTCQQVPGDAPACDHLEQIVVPAETLGSHYVVPVSTAPAGIGIGHVVRLVGNVDGTKLTWAPSKPTGAPDTLDAGQVVDLGQVTMDFEVKGTAPFAIVDLMMGGSLIDPSSLPGEQRGDPSQSIAVPVEQFRTKYVFLAPDDYLVSYADVVLPAGAKLTLDGASLLDTSIAIGSTGYSVQRIKLGAGPAADGAHVLESDQPVGLQVIGYGLYTSYQYPGGLNLLPISSPPVR